MILIYFHVYQIVIVENRCFIVFVLDKIGLFLQVKTMLILVVSLLRQGIQSF